MTIEDKLKLLKAMSGESDSEVLSTYLSIAGDKVLRKAYPFGTSTKEIPEKYGYIQVEVAVYLLNKRGAEGETSHSENGISRSYEGGDVPPSLLRDIVPFSSKLTGGDPT